MHHRFISRSITIRRLRRRKILYFNRNIFCKACLYAFVLFTFILGGNQSKAQDSPDQNLAGEHENAYQDAKKYQKSITARATLSNDIGNLDLRDRKYGERTIRYRRDAELYAGAFVYYNGFGIGSRLGVADIKNPDAKKVEAFDVTASYFSRSFGAELYYGRYGRYYISSSPYGGAGLWNYLNRGSRMKSEAGGLNLFLFLRDFFTLNKSYSYSAAFEQAEKQVKSSGTLFFLLSGDYNRMRSDVSIIPLYAHELLMFTHLLGLKRWLFGGFAAGIGFAYTLVLPADFFISTYIALSIRPLQKELSTCSGTKREFRIDSLRGKGKIYAGYNSDPFFAGICLIYEGILTPCYRFKAEMWSGDLSVQFFSGVRI